MVHPEKISDQAEAEHYRHELRKRSQRRTQKRRLVFASAGFAITSLIAASFIAITSMERMSIAPPKPNFSGLNTSLETISEDLRDRRTVRDQQSTDKVTTAVLPAIEAPVQDPTDPATANLSPSAGDEAADQGSPASDNPFDDAVTQPNQTPPADPVTTRGTETDRATEGADQQGSAGQDPTVSPLTTLDSRSETLVAPTTTPSEPKDEFRPLQEGTGSARLPDQTHPPVQSSGRAPAQAPVQGQAASPSINAEVITPAQEDADMRASCILGYAVMAQAEDRSHGTDGAAMDRMANLAGTTEAACSSLALSSIDIVRGMAKLDEVMVKEMAINILNGTS